MNKKRLRGAVQLMGEEYGRYRASILGLIGFGCMSGLLEGVGITAIIPLFAFVNNSSNKGSDIISQFIGQLFMLFHVEYTLRHLLLFIMGLFLLKALVGYGTTALAARIYTSYERSTRSALFGLTMTASWPYLARQKVGHLEQVLTTDVTNGSVLLSYVGTSVLIAVNLLVYTLLVINISAIVAACTVVFGISIFFMFKPLFYRNRAVSERVETMYKELAHYVSEHMLGMKTIKALFAQAPIRRHADTYFDQVQAWNRTIVAARNTSTVLLQPIGLVFVIGIFTFFYKFQAFNFASFAVIVYAINKVFAYLQMAQTQLHGVSSLIPYIGSIKRYRDDVRAHQESDDGKKPFLFEKILAFRDVDFSYPDREKAALHRISFEVRRGEMAGIIGPSGAGKTTLVDMLLRLYRPDAGDILVDGVSIRDVGLADWRAAVGYVAQDMFLMNDTIEHNIKFYHPELTDEEMIAAAKMANIYEFILQQPEQFQTVIGERGALISGGEKQRIVLARVLARRPAILILDEATSALDNESESLIQEAIERMKGKMTVIIIAHRLSTIIHADTLIAIEHGRIQEQGSPKELLQKKDSYFSRVHAMT